MMIEQFSGRVRDAAARKQALRIRGGGTKDFYGQSLLGEVLDTRALTGIVAYEPTELVITARTGTPLAELEALLAEKGQMLAFEPPHFSGGEPNSQPPHFGDVPSPLAPLPREGEGNIVPAAPGSRLATLGGCIASGLSGPRRATAGAARDFVLGVKIMDGRGEVQTFGGQVMKNVAGYDVSRLMTGAMGTLGLLLEVSLKVLPLPPAEVTVGLEMPEDKALETMNRWAGRPLPISATCWNKDAHGETLTVRLSGAKAAVTKARQQLGGELVPDADEFWRKLREQRHPFFAAEGLLWRLALPSTCAAVQLPGAQLIEWGGSLRWFKSNAGADRIREVVASAGGHATLFRGGSEEERRAVGVFHPLAAPLSQIHRKLKQAFDPAGIFNPGRMYEDW